MTTDQFTHLVQRGESLLASPEPVRLNVLDELLTACAGEALSVRAELLRLSRPARYRSLVPLGPDCGPEPAEHLIEDCLQRWHTLSALLERLRDRRDQLAGPR